MIDSKPESQDATVGSCLADQIFYQILAAFPFSVPRHISIKIRAESGYTSFSGCRKYRGLHSTL